MLLILRAKHFKGTEFGSCSNCALAKAAKEQFGSNNINEGVSDIEIDGIEYDHRRYEPKEFREDKERAEQLGFDDSIIKRIKLTKI